MAPPTPTSVMLVSGEYFDPYNPDPAVITLDVLAAGLHAPRFNGQTIRLISIAEHSLRVRRIVRELGLIQSGMSDHATQLWALLHDAHEAIVPWGDCLSPGKTDAMKDVESRVDDAICRALGIKESATVWSIVKIADAIALYFEAMLWQPGALDWALDVVPWARVSDDSLAADIERFMPLIAPRPSECWRTEVEALLVRSA
jgi:hypothetical protein